MLWVCAAIPSGMNRAVLYRCWKAALSSAFLSTSSFPFSQIMSAMKVRFTASLDTCKTNKTELLKEQRNFTHKGRLAANSGSLRWFFFFYCSQIKKYTWIHNDQKLEKLGWMFTTVRKRENVMLRVQSVFSTCRITPSALRCCLLLTMTTRPTDSAFSPFTDSRMAFWKQDSR